MELDFSTILSDGSMDEVPQIKTKAWHKCSINLEWETLIIGMFHPSGSFKSKTSEKFLSCWYIFASINKRNSYSRFTFKLLIIWNKRKSKRKCLNHFNLQLSRR